MYQQQNQVQNKPTAAYVISLIGGILGLFGSLSLIAFAFLSLNYSGYFGSDMYGLFGWSWTFFFGLGAWMLITSILIIFFSIKLNANPLEHIKWGALILIFSIIGVGGLIGIIGGILALVYKPILVGTPQQQYGPPSQQPYYGSSPQQATYIPQQQTTRVCPHCGRIVQANERFCPNCGKQLY
ncbi:MAG: DUF4064 domain-containing protein [Ignavibacteria bacterium]